MAGRRAVAVAVAAALATAGCGAAGAPDLLAEAQGRALAEASQAILGACARGPLTPEQRSALRPRLQRLIDATKRDPDALFEYPQADQNPLLTSPSLELQAVVGALGGVGVQPVCDRQLSEFGDRGLIAAGENSMLADMPSTAR